MKSAALGPPLRAVGVIGLCLTPLLTHAAVLAHWPAALPALLLAAQAGALSTVLLARAKPVKKGLIALSAALLVGLTVWRFGTAGLAYSSGLPHAAGYVAMLILFGNSLRPDHEPVVSAMARKIRGSLPDDVARYTRTVTKVWCGFFIFQLAGSALLLLTVPLTAWSFFINVLNFPLLFLMFTAEIVVRLIQFRHHPRSKLTDMLKVVSGWRGPLANHAD